MLLIILGVILFIGGLIFGIKMSYEEEDDGVAFVVCLLIAALIWVVCALTITCFSSSELPAQVIHKETFLLEQYPDSEQYILLTVNEDGVVEYNILCYVTDNTIQQKTFTPKEVKVHYVSKNTQPYYQHKTYEYKNSFHKFCLINQFPDTIDIYVPLESAGSLLPTK